MAFRATSDRRRIRRLRTNPTRSREQDHHHGQKSLDAEIEAQRKANEVAADDHKAQNICMVIATAAYSILPYAGFGSAIACAAFGQPVAATFGALIGAVTAGPQIIQGIRKKR